MLTYRKRKRYATFVYIFLIVLAFVAFGHYVDSASFQEGKKAAGKWIVHLLLPRVVDITLSDPKTPFDLVYILGGSQPSLSLKFETARDICKKHGCKEIIMLSRPGITEYSESAGRNLTNDEWALLRMKRTGLSVEKIEFVRMKDEFFGTYNEAKTISGIINERSHDKIALISSAYHTKRVRVSFEKFLKDQKVKVFVYGSKDTGSAYVLIVEYLKLKFYQFILM